MRIYLIKTPEFSEEEFQQTYNLLDSFEGPLEFLKVDIVFDKNMFPFLEKFYPDFKFKYLADKLKIRYDNERGDPLSWQELFSLCSYYRKTFSVENEDFVVLLTNRRNALNWFSAFDDKRNIFVHTDEWNSYTNANPKYPIGYQIIENVIQFLMKLDITSQPNPNIHQPPKGCMNDFCYDKGQVILKLQTANICQTCIDKIQSEKVDSEILEQALRIFEGVRNELIFKISRKVKQTSKHPLTITNTNKILIEDLNLEIRLRPMEKTLYIFYLKQNDGIPFRDLIDYEDELLRIYGKVSTSDDLEVQRRRIAALVNPLEGAFSIQKSKINRNIQDLLGQEISEYYKISGAAGNPFEIKLPKHLIQFQN